eukprot:TRINITY_DN3568_c1_g1_i1.p1 TRINITY_DN3568_c1_g1~~TRINITY_DN3568_c1_g1_i1.p1  ORF type:complete len:1280 (+),score=364.67 TRINITY_DN3568_c1_g1_i1:58-3897(+)
MSVRSTLLTGWRQRNIPIKKAGRGYCTNDAESKLHPARKRTVWSSLETKSRDPQDDDEEELRPDMVPHTFGEYLKHCKIVGAINMPDLFIKEGLPEKVATIITSLKDISCLHLLDDDAFYYLLMCGWLPEMRKNTFRVFDNLSRVEEWKAMLRVINSMPDQWGPKTLAALMHTASAMGLTEECLELYRTAEEKGVLTRYSLPSVMYSLGHSKDLDKAGQIFRWIEEKGVRGEDYRSFIFANSKVGNWRDAKYYYELYRKTRVGEPASYQDEKVMTTLLAAYSRGRNWKGANEIFEEITMKYPPTDIHTSALIASNANGSINGYNRARMCFLRSYDITYTSSANAWMKVMIKVYDSLRKIIHDPVDGVEKSLSDKDHDFTVFRRLGLFKIKHLSNRLWKLYEIMKSYPSHYKPNAITYFHALQFAKVTRNPDMAMVVLRDAANDGVKHVVLYNLAISAFARCVDIAGTFALFKEMRAEKLTPDIGTYAALVESLGPGQGTNNAITVMDAVEKSGLEPNGALLAGCVRAFGSASTVPHLIKAVRTAVEQSTATESPDQYVLDSAWFWHCLERPMQDRDISNSFFSEYPDFNERAFEVAAGPLQHLRAPREVHASLEDMKQWFTVTPGKSVWVLTDEWMLPLGNSLRDVIDQTLEAKDKIVVPYYCLLRLGNIVRKGHAHIKLRESAFVVLTILQELFDESANATARGDLPIVDTVYFSEQLFADPILHNLMEKQDMPEWDKERKEELGGYPIPYDVELFSTESLQSNPTLRNMSRRSVAYAKLIQQFQVSMKSQVFFCGRDREHLALAKKVGLETASVEDVLGPDWLKKRTEEDEKLMLSWKAPEDTLGIEARQSIPALTESSYNANEYLQQNVVNLGDKQSEKQVQQKPAEPEMVAKYTPPSEVEKDEEQSKPVVEAEPEVKKDEEQAVTNEDAHVIKAEPEQVPEAPVAREPVDDTLRHTEESPTEEPVQVAQPVDETPLTVWPTWGTTSPGDRASLTQETAQLPSSTAPHSSAEALPVEVAQPVDERPLTVWPTWGKMCEDTSAPEDMAAKPSAQPEALPADAETEPEVPTESEEPSPVKTPVADTAETLKQQAEEQGFVNFNNANEEEVGAESVKPKKKKEWGGWGAKKALKRDEDEISKPDETPKAAPEEGDAVQQQAKEALKYEAEQQGFVNFSKAAEADEEKIDESAKPKKKKEWGGWGAKKETTTTPDVSTSEHQTPPAVPAADKEALKAEAEQQGFVNFGAGNEDIEEPKKKKKKKKEWGGWGSKKPSDKQE